jgi:hypothetical protein
VQNFYITWKEQSVNFVGYIDCCGFKRDESAYDAGGTGKEEQP